MIQAQVQRNENTLFGFASVKQIRDFIYVWRLEDVSRIATYGPHFSMLLPAKGVWRALEGRTPVFSAAGGGLLGQVHFVDGSVARDGREAYEIAKLDAKWAATKSGVSISASVQLGEPDPNSFPEPDPKSPLAYQPRSRDGEDYRISIQIPLELLPDFLDIRGQDYAESRLNDIVLERFEIDLRVGPSLL